MADIINRWNVNGVYYQIHDYGRGIPGGVATLDSEGRIPYEQMPLTSIAYKGAWEADSNVPDLVAIAQSGEVTKGDMYICISSGSQNLGGYKYTVVTPSGSEDPSALGWYEYDGTDYVASTDTTVISGKTYYVRTAEGTIRYLLGDRIIWDGQQWERMPAGGVTSVNNKVGDVVLTGEDIAFNEDTSDTLVDKINNLSTNKQDKRNANVTGTLSGTTLYLTLH